MLLSRLSREEREEMYKVVRQRIFGSTEDTTSGEHRKPFEKT